MSSNPRPANRTPAGFQSRRAITFRRAVFFAANIALTGALMFWLGSVLSPGGIGLLDALLLASLLIPVAWVVFLFVNALIALTLILFWRDPMRVTSPFARQGGDAPLTRRYALLMTIRNEAPSRVFDRLRAMRESLDATGEGAAFDVFVLSDTSDAAIAAEEERRFRAQEGPLAGAGAAHYRRRESNAGFKAGNIRDWVETSGADYEAMLCLDADSLMDGETILAQARTIEAAPRLAILQSLILPAPGETAFTRMLRFGAQCTVRSHYLGHAWWQADAGPFGGHNALVRVAPFRTHGALPEIDAPPPLGGAVLGHDHVEAALLNGAGYEVRLLPEGCGSWEDYPVSAPEFSARDRRWGRGNIQYAHLIGLPGLGAMNRFHIAHLFSLFLVPPALLLSVLLAALKPIESDAGQIDAAPVVLVLLALALFPKLVGALDMALGPRGTRPFGGPLRFWASTALETGFTLLLAPPVLALTGLSVLSLGLGAVIGVDLRRGPVWGAQERDGRRLSWKDAARQFWAPTGLGMALTLWAVAVAPSALPLAALGLAGLLFAIPFAVLSASSRLGCGMRRAGLFLIPAETEPATILQQVSAMSTR